MNRAFFNLRLKSTTGGLNWDKNGSIGSHDLKIKQIPSQEKFSACRKDDPQKLGFLRRGAQLKMVEMEKIGKNRLSINKMKGNVL